MNENLYSHHPALAELVEERDQLTALVASQRDALEAATAYVELFTKNGTRKPPPKWAIKPDGDFDAQEISDRARAVLQTSAMAHAAFAHQPEVTQPLQNRALCH